MSLSIRAGLACYLLFLPVGWLFADQASPRSATRSPHGTLNMPCENCHTLTSWKPVRARLEFDHNKTRYPLRGLHQDVSCTECHVSLVFTNVGTKCADCHADIHKGQLGQKCEQCHTVNGWQASVQSNMSHLNRFPLVGAHASLSCDDCHQGAAVSQFQGLSTECVACHSNVLSTAQPDHHALQFPSTCQTCHTMDSWLGASFDHLKYTGFALTGMHATLECAACHVNGNYQLTITNCAGCHLKDYNATTNPNHIQAKFSQHCASCHNTANWTSVTFNHNITGFPLTGGHAGLQCTQCHLNNNYNLTSGDCATCHMADYRS